METISPRRGRSSGSPQLLSPTHTSNHALSGNSAKRKRPSPILTALPSDACAIPVSEQQAEASVSLSLGASAQSAQSDPCAGKATDGIGEHNITGTAQSDIHDDERLGKLSRSAGAADVSKGSPVVLQNGVDGRSTSVTPRALSSLRASPTNAVEQTTVAASASPTASPTCEHASGTVLAALSARTAVSNASLSRQSSATSAVTSAESTPMHRSLMLAAGGLPSLSVLSTPSWSPLASSLAGSAAVTGRTGHSRIGPSSSSFAFSSDPMTSAIPAAGASPQSVRAPGNGGTVPTTPPSNVASPSASPRRIPDEEHDPSVLPPFSTTVAEHVPGSNNGIPPYSKLTVNTNSTFLNASARTNAIAGHLSPSSSAAHSPTSTASQLRTHHSLQPPLSRAAMLACASPAVSVAPTSSPSAAPMNTPTLHLGTPVLGSSNSGPLAAQLSPRCVRHASDPHSSIHGSPQRHHAALAISAGGSGSSTGSASAGARSPCPSPSSQAASWTKPFFLSRLHVNIPEMSPLIPSPVPLAPIDTPAGAPRPSMAQSAKDRERELRGGTPSSGTTTSHRLVLMSPQAGSTLPTVAESSSSVLLTSPVAHADGVASRGPHYAISLLKGHRRRMEDMFLQATIELEEPRRAATTASASHKAAESVAVPPATHETADGDDTHVSLDPREEEPSSPPANLFGIADGHGKAGALVAQLTAQLLPVMLQRNISKVFAPSAAADIAPTVSSHVPLSAAAAAVGASLFSPPPRATTLRNFTAMSPLQLQFGSPAPTSTHAALPPLHSNSTGSSLPSLLLSPGHASAASSSRPPPSPVVLPAASPSASPAAVTPAASPVPVPTPSPPTQAELDAVAALGLVLDEPTCAVDPVARALQNTFLQVDAHILAGKHNGGTTCTTVYIHQSPVVATPNTTDGGTSAASLYVAHVGDSRAVLSRAGQVLALSSDHKPHRPDERARVEAAGGQVVFYSGWRVDGTLNISRALGDASFKDEVAPLRGRVIALPEISRHAVEEQDEFVIVASDGVWGRVSNQQAVDIVRKVLLEGDPTSADERNAADTDEALPPHPSLAHEHSYMLSDANGVHGGLVSNPVQTPRVVPVHRTSAGLGREDSTDTMVSSIDGGSMGGSMIASAQQHLNSKGSFMSTTFSPMTALPSAPTAPPTSAKTVPRTPAHGGKPSLLSPAYSTLGSSASHGNPFASPLSSGGNGGSGVGASGFRRGFLLSPAQSSTRLTSPTGALSFNHTDSVASSAGATPTHVTSMVQNSMDASGGCASSLPPSALPCCRSSLLAHPERVSMASEALIQYAFEQANSMDNLSACVVLLHPFQQAHTTESQLHAL